MHSKAIRLSALAISLLFCAAAPIRAHSQNDPVPPLLTPSLSQQSAITTTAGPHPLLSDVRVRRAIAFCTDRQALAAAAFPTLSVAEQQSLVSDSFIAQANWLHQSPPITYTYNFSPTLGQQLLDAAGWALAPSATYRTNADGYELALKFTTTDSVWRRTWAPALEEQWRDNCGIHLVRFHLPAGVWFSDEKGLLRRNFELGEYAWSPNNIIPLGVVQYGCDFIPSADNLWQGQNYAGWCNPAASQALQSARTALLKQNRFDLYGIAQNEFAKDAVVLPLFHRARVIAADKNLTGLQVGPSEAVYDWNVYDWAIPNAQTITLGSLIHEPLFTHLSASSGNLGVGVGLVTSLIYGRGVTTLNHDFQARLYDSIPTLENGGAVTQTVSVTEGDTVVGADGALRTLLALGDQIINSSGQVITYTGGAVSMTQIIVTGAFLPNMRWPDGQLMTLADLELWDTVHCNPTVGVYAERCTWIQHREYLDSRTARYTLYPGYASPLYSAFLPNAYPSHRILSDGRSLGEVPPAEWSNLPEIMERPMGLGPYQLVARQFTDGERMTFSANPYFALGQPQTPNLEVRIFSDSNAAVVELLAGQVDVIGDDLLGTGSELAAVVNAAHSGLIQALILPGPIWEHIDLNQGLFTTIAIKALPPAGGVITTALGLRADFPPGVLTDSTTITLNHLREPGLPMPNTDDYYIRGFTLTATDSTGQPLPSLSAPITLTLTYTDTELMSFSGVSPWAVSATRLQLAYLDLPQKAWVNVLPCVACGIDMTSRQVTVRVNQLGEFALYGNNRVYLPWVSNEATLP